MVKGDVNIMPGFKYNINMKKLVMIKRYINYLQTRQNIMINDMKLYPKQSLMYEVTNLVVKFYSFKIALLESFV